MKLNTTKPGWRNWTVKILWLSVIAVCAVPVFGFSAEPVVEPVHPSKLLELMPKPPLEWKCLESQGQTIVSVSNVPVTYAVRIYEIAGEESKAPWTLKIVAMDAGSDQYLVEDFRKRLKVGTGGQTAANGRLMTAGGLEGKFITVSGQKARFDGLAGQRLVVQVEGDGVEAEKIEKALQMLDFTALVTGEKGLAGRQLKTMKYTTYRVDELKPSANQVSSIRLVESSNVPAQTQSEAKANQAPATPVNSR